MGSSIRGKVIFALFVLLLLAAVELWGSYPFYEPDAVQNAEEEVELAPQRYLPMAKDTLDTTSTRATFGGNPYLVGPIVTPTSTVSEAETNIAINPVNPANFVALITDYSLRSGGIATNGVSKYVVSNDGGNTWTESFVPTLNTAYGATADGHSWLVDRDPGVAMDAQGYVYLSGLYLKFGPGGSAKAQTNSGSISRSTTPGGVYVCGSQLPNISMTAANCHVVYTDTEQKPTTSVDRDWIAADWTNGPYAGNVYAVWTHYTGCSGQTCQTKFIAFSRSTDHGMTWSPITQINLASHTIVDWSMVTVGSDGTVYVAYEYYIQINNERQHWAAKSTDGGVTFSTPVKMTPTFRNVVFRVPYRINSAPNIVVSSVAGQEYLYDVFARQNGNGSDISFVRSKMPKGGGGYTPIVALNDSTAGQREYPTAAVDGNGTLHAIWLDTRNSPTDSSQYDVYGTYSKDLGVTFAPNARITPGLINGNTDFLGDYFGITVEPSTGIAHPVWTNGGDLNGQLQTTTLTPQ
jgi:hypothetical protein